MGELWVLFSEFFGKNIPHNIGSALLLPSNLWPAPPTFSASGLIDRDELKVVLQSCMEESAMQLSDEDLQDLTDALFDEADEDGSGAITFEELVGELEKFPGVMENLTMRYVFQKFNCITAKVCEWMNNFIPHFIMDIMNYYSRIRIINHISKCDPSMNSYPSSSYTPRQK